MTRAGSEPCVSYHAFWPLYLREHQRPGTRYTHISGTLIALTCLVSGILSADFWLLLAALIAGYGPAWIAHAVIEKNKPLTWRYPLWSLMSDIRMTAAWLTGNLNRELQSAGISQPGR